MNVSSSILTASNLAIGYKRGKKVLKKVHHNLCFELKQGELTCLLGPNGAGKSTLLRTLGAAQHVLGGEIYLDGKRLESYKEKELSKSIGLVLTDKIFAGGLRVSELVALGRHPHTGFFGRLSSYDYAIIDKALSDTGILDKKDAYVAELSDGERQKAMIAKALAQESDIIILDEPTSFLDIISRIEVMHLLRELARKHNKAILLSTHDLEQALLSADRLWLLAKNKGITCGTPEDLVFNGEIDQLFEHRHIHLDRLNGNFRRNTKTQYLLQIKTDPSLLFWTRNLLNRYGFGDTENRQTAVGCLEIINNRNMILNTDQTSFSFHSFEELAVWLKKHG